MGWILFYFFGGGNQWLMQMNGNTDRAPEEEQEAKWVPICHLPRESEAQATAGLIVGGVNWDDNPRGPLVEVKDRPAHVGKTAMGSSAGSSCHSSHGTEGITLGAVEEYPMLDGSNAVCLLGLSTCTDVGGCLSR